jgi:hypothetical protein
VNAKRTGETFERVTMGHLRGHGVMRPFVSCGSINCSHSSTIDGELFPDDFVPRSLGSRMRCEACGHVGADVRPDWSQHTNRPGAGRAHT